MRHTHQKITCMLFFLSLPAFMICRTADAFARSTYVTESQLKDEMKGKPPHHLNIHHFPVNSSHANSIATTHTIPAQPKPTHQNIFQQSDANLILGFTGFKCAYSLVIHNVLQHMIAEKQIAYPLGHEKMHKSHLRILGTGSNAPSKKTSSLQRLRLRYVGAMPRMGMMISQSFASTVLYTYGGSISQNQISPLLISALMGSSIALMGPVDALVTHKIKAVLTAKHTIQTQVFNGKKQSNAAPSPSYRTLFHQHKKEIWRGSGLHGFAHSISWFSFLSTVPIYHAYRDDCQGENAQTLKYFYAGSYAGGLGVLDALVYCPISNLKRYMQVQNTQITGMGNIVRSFYGHYGCRGFFRGAQLTGVSGFFSNILNISYINYMRDRSLEQSDLERI